jgi:von Willebrand factor type A domain
MSYNTNTVSEFICDIESKIQFDGTIVPTDFTTITNPELTLANFGIVNLKIKQKQPINVKRHFVFTIDCSGSMSDLCNDKRTKNDHSIHTLINMITYFAEHPKLNVSITVFAFDGNIYNIIKNEEVTQDNLDNLIQNIKKIRPKDTTNIEKALINSNEYISDYIENNIDIFVTHIFMTDGDATQGNELPSELKEMVAPRVPNIFIGFGIDHNAYLLRELASESRNSYYFVDALEKAGLVYGEILHSIIYRVLEKTTITTKNGLIYDWKKNIWVHELDVGDLISENNKIFHILSDKPLEFSCIVETTDCVTKKEYELSIKNTINKKRVNDECIECDHYIIEYDGFIDLNKYKYRQRTQQLLFEVNIYNFEKYKRQNPFKFNNKLVYSPSADGHNDHDDDSYKSIKTNKQILKEKMKNLLEEIQQFLEKITSASDDYNFIKLLCDDLYICLQTFDTEHGAMFSCARQVSQGAQRAYSATCTPNSHRNLRNRSQQHPNVFNMKRSIAINDNDIDIHDDDDDYIQLNTTYNFPEFNYDELNNDNFNKEFYQNTNDDSADDNDTDYNLSTHNDNPYSTLSILDLMRSCSNNNSCK